MVRVYASYWLVGGWVILHFCFEKLRCTIINSVSGKKNFVVKKLLELSFLVKPKLLVPETGFARSFQGLTYCLFWL